MKAAGSDEVALPHMTEAGDVAGDTELWTSRARTVEIKNPSIEIRQNEWKNTIELAGMTVPETLVRNLVPEHVALHQREVADLVIGETLEAAERARKEASRDFIPVKGCSPHLLSRTGDLLVDEGKGIVPTLERMKDAAMFDTTEYMSPILQAIAYSLSGKTEAADMISLHKKLLKTIDEDQGDLLVRVVKSIYPHLNPGCYAMLKYAEQPSWRKAFARYMRNTHGGIVPEMHQSWVITSFDTMLRERRNLRVAEINRLVSEWAAELSALLPSLQNDEGSKAEESDRDEWMCCFIPAEIEAIFTQMGFVGINEDLQNLSAGKDSVIGKYLEAKFQHSLSDRAKTLIEIFSPLRERLLRAFGVNKRYHVNPLSALGNVGQRLGEVQHFLLALKKSKVTEDRMLGEFFTILSLKTMSRAIELWTADVQAVQSFSDLLLLWQAFAQQENNLDHVLLYLGLSLKCNVLLLQDETQLTHSFVFDENWPLAMIYHNRESNETKGLRVDGHTTSVQHLRETRNFIFPSPSLKLQFSD